MAKQKSDLSRAFSEDGARKTHVGGQALLGGVMMRGKYNWAVAVREPSGGMYTEEHDLASGRPKNGWMSWPLVRGCRAFVESLVLGYKALEIAALHAFDDEEEAGETPGADQAVRGAEEAGAADAPRFAAQNPSDSSCASLPHALDERPSDADSDGVQRASAAPASSAPLPGEGRGSACEVSSGVRNPVDSEPSCSSREASAGSDSSEEKEPEFGKKEMAFSMVLGLVLGVVLFIVAPAAITNVLVGEYDEHTLLWNVVDGLLRVAVFVGYLWLIGRMSDIKSMFGYHGAEHKTIHCYEHGLPLTPENARSFPRLHVRCGTAFLIMVMIIAIFVYTVIPVNALIAAWGVPDGLPKLALVVVVRILFMPVIAGISYEITVKWAGSHPDNPLVKVILWPGMQMQYLTTNEPDDEQLECAIAAMQLVLEREEQEAAAVQARCAVGAAPGGATQPA